MGAEDGCEADGANRDADTFADLGCGVLDRGDGASPVARGGDRRRLARPREGAACASVDLDAAAHHDVFERRAFGCGTEDRRGGLIGEGCRNVRCGAGVGLPDADMDEHVRVELGDGLDDSVVLVGVNPVEDRTLEPMSRGIGIDTRQFPHPRLRLEKAGDRGAEFATHTAHEHPFSSHHHER